MRKWKKLLIIAAALCMLTGCGDAVSENINMISIQKDGKVEHTIVEQFDRNYYDADELSQMAEEKIGRYNGGDGSITCESVEAGEGKIVVKMIYQSEADYMEFNNRELFCGTVEQASAKGYSLQNLVSAEGEVLSSADLGALSDNQVVIVQTKKGEELDVRVYGTIVYASEDITLSGNKDALITAGEDDRLSCIIFN